jgi:Fe-S cluster assembly ATPase SufC
MLEVKNLAVAVEDREILHNVSLTIDTGETHILFGPADDHHGVPQIPGGEGKYQL